MIYNATLLRVDLPSPNPPGNSIEVRCALTPLSASQAELSALAGWGATCVVYVPLRRVPSPRPVATGHVLMRADGEDEEVLYAVKEVLQRNSPTLGHIQLYLAPA
jgi:hypothetical protein